MKNISGRDANTKGAAASLRAATKPENLRNDEDETVTNSGFDGMKASFKRFEHI